MSNPDGTPNMNIAKYAKPFGSEGGPDPSAAGKKGAETNHTSVRLSLRRLAAVDFDVTQPMTPQEIAKKFGRKGTAISGAQALAMKKFSEAMKGNAKILQQVTDDIDGRQVQAVVQAKTTLEEIVAKSYDEKYLKEPVDDDTSTEESGA